MGYVEKNFWSKCSKIKVDHDKLCLSPDKLSFAAPNAQKNKQTRFIKRKTVFLR